MNSNLPWFTLKWLTICLPELSITRAIKISELIIENLVIYSSFFFIEIPMSEVHYEELRNRNNIEKNPSNSYGQNAASFTW